MDERCSMRQANAHGRRRPAWIGRGTLLAVAAVTLGTVWMPGTSRDAGARLDAGWVTRGVVVGAEQATPRTGPVSWCSIQADGTIVGCESEIACRDWHSWHDYMPGTPPTLFVVGTCRVPAPGYQLALQPRPLQPGYPEDSFLDLVLQPPSPPPTIWDVDPSAGTDIELRYEVDTPTYYRTATVVGYASMLVEETM